MSYSSINIAMIEAAKAAYDNGPEISGMTGCIIIPDGDGYAFKFVPETRYAYLEHDVKYQSQVIYLLDGKKQLSDWQKATATTALDEANVDDPEIEAILRAALYMHFEDDDTDA